MRIDALITIAEAVGGSVAFTHVKAHTKNRDHASVGNRIADRTANRARTSRLVGTPRRLKQMPIDECERRCAAFDCRAGAAMIDDPRRTSMASMRTEAMRLLQTMPSHCDTQGRFACVGTVALGVVIRKLGTQRQQVMFLHVATNSVQWIVVKRPPPEK